jgi:hypothetical protein
LSDLGMLANGQKPDSKPEIQRNKPDRQAELERRKKNGINTIKRMKGKYQEIFQRPFYMSIKMKSKNKLSRRGRYDLLLRILLNNTFSFLLVPFKMSC